MTLTKHVLIFVCALIFFLTPASVAADVTLLWDSNVESDLAGYQIGYGIAPGEYRAFVDVGNHTSYRFTTLEAGRTYYFAVRAYNFDGLSSPFSLEVSATTAPPRPLELTNLVANHRSPMPVGTRIVFGAAPTGGVPPYQYKWFVSAKNVKTLTKAWSTDNTFVWTPMRRGRYTVTVWVRNAGSVVNAPANAASVRTMSFDIVADR